MEESQKNDDGSLITAYQPPNGSDSDVSAIAGQGFGFAPFRAARMFRVLTGAVSTLAPYAGLGVVEFTDGSPTAETVLGHAFTILSGGDAGETAADANVATGPFTDAEAMTIKDDNSVGLVMGNSHYKVRGVIIKPIAAFDILATTTADAIKRRRSDPFIRSRSDGGPSLAEELARQVLEASFVIIKDQVNANGCKERLGNAALWVREAGAPQSDGFWYLETPFISGPPGSDSVEVTITLGSEVKVAAPAGQVPLDAGTPFFKLVYGFEVILVGEPGIGKLTQRQSACGIPQVAGKGSEGKLEKKVDSLVDTVNTLATVVSSMARNGNAK